MEFTRTDLGKTASYLFYDKPLVWVEGREDIEVFTYLASRYDFLLMSAGGREECLKLCHALRIGGYPYIVVLDGDYGVLTRSRSPHRRCIHLRRYSMENYLADHNIVVQFCRAACHAEAGSGDAEFTMMYESVMQGINFSLQELIVLDVARELSRARVKVLPDSYDALLDKNLAAISPPLVQRISDAVRASLDPSAIAEAEFLVSEFVKVRPLWHLANGHLVLGALRRILGRATTSRGVRFTADLKMMRITLSLYAWQSPTSEDHRRFLTQLRSGLREVRRARGNE